MKANRTGVFCNLSHRELAILIIGAALASAVFNIVPGSAKVLSLPINLLVPVLISAVAVAVVLIDKRRCSATPEQTTKEA